MAGRSGKGWCDLEAQVAGKDDIWEPFEEDGYPEDLWSEVRAALDQLRPLSLQALVAVYRMTMSEEVEKAFGKQLERMAKRMG